MTVIRDSSLSAVLTLGDAAIVGGYVITDYDEGRRRHKRLTTSAPRVESQFDVASELDRVLLNLEVFIEGDDWSTIRTRHRALLAAVEVADWVLDMGDGVAWRCAKADSTSPIPGRALEAEGRFVTLEIPAHPTYGI